MSLSGRVLVILVAILWGFNFVIIRWGMEGVDPITMTTLRFFFTAVPLIFFFKRPNIPVRILALYGILFGVGIWGLVNLAVSVGTPAGYASLLLQLSAFLTVIAGVVIFKESLTFTKKIGIGIAFLGFFTIVFNKGENIPSLGIVLMLLAAAFWTSCNIIIKITKPNDIVSFIAWSSLFVPIPLAIIMLLNQSVLNANISEALIFQLPTIKGWVSILFQSFVTTLLGYGIWSYSIAKHGLSNVAPYSLLVPVSGLFFGWLIYQEYLSMPELIGSSLVVLGLMMLSLNGLPSFMNKKVKSS